MESQAVDSNTSSFAMTAGLSDSSGDVQQSIVLIGFRGIGKSTLGLIAATHLNRAFIDADRLLSRTAGCSPNEYIAKHSWEKFRDLETHILRKILTDHPTGYVVACGGGVVEREENRSMLISFARDYGGKVIHVTREKENVIRYLINEKDRPQWGEEIRSVWTRRYPLYEECSTHTYVSLTAGRESHISGWPSLILKDVERSLMRFIRLLSPSPFLQLVPQDRRTYSITIDCAVPQSINFRTMSSVTNGVDALELRVDSLQNPSVPLSSPNQTPQANPGCPDPSYVAFAIAHLRKISTLPIIYTVRTVRQGGSFVLDKSTREAYITLALTAFRLGAECIDLELELGQSIIEAILARKPSYTKIIISHSDHSRHLRWSMPETARLYARCVEAGADIVKLSLYAATAEDNLKLHNFLQQLQNLTPSPAPLIAVNLGKNGKMSSLFNTFLTPVSHPYLPSPPILGQSTFKNIQKALVAVGISQHRKIACSRVSQPVQDLLDRKSILTHGCGTLALPFTVENSGGADWDEDFGGALVSVDADSHLLEGEVKPAAHWTGHIDTISISHTWLGFGHDTTPSRHNSPSHHNTVTYHNIRSLAIAEVIELGLSPINAVTSLSVAILVGARGLRGREAYFALKHLGLKCIYCFECEASLHDPGIRTVHTQSPITFSIPHEHYPTIILSFSSTLLASTLSTSTHRLFASPTGGTIVELDTIPNRPIATKSLLEESRSKPGWVSLSCHDVEIAAIKKEFAVLTNHRLPLEALNGHDQICTAV